MLLRLTETHALNLSVLQEMQLLGPDQAGFYFVRLVRTTAEFLDLAVAKDRAMAKRVFGTLYDAWAVNETLDWVQLLKELYRPVVLPEPWTHGELLVRDLEPRVMIRMSQSDYKRGAGAADHLLTTKVARELIASVQQSTTTVRTELVEILAAHDFEGRAATFCATTTWSSEGVQALRMLGGRDAAQEEAAHRADLLRTLPELIRALEAALAC